MNGNWKIQMGKYFWFPLFNLKKAQIELEKLYFLGFFAFAILNHNHLKINAERINFEMRLTARILNKVAFKSLLYFI